ncbi:hypothetical protein [Lolliginicoccus suaedae]|uniref:hypothetical protein n=1 Tax=Lolliginicoccus suaedae TaxID=2605429 RepID=UPI0011EE0165|nr:hypothetical protein [Lolliginicoccus suaedae]
MATNSFSGHGGADDVGEWIGIALNAEHRFGGGGPGRDRSCGTSKTSRCSSAASSGIGRNLTSDIIARLF